MTVQACRAIYFDCEKCDHGQYADYTLDHDWEDDRAVYADNIDCEKCGHTNRVIEEM
jgi:hypothetical protein